MMATTTGCTTKEKGRMKIPGNPKLSEYGITFEIDWDVFESGTYVYDPKNVMKGLPHRIGGGVYGYLYFYTLIMDFKFKDGREFHEEIDLKPLILEMVKKHTIPDLNKTKWGGRAAIIITVENNKLVLDYQVSEYVKKGNPMRHLSKRYFFPIFEKTLN